MKRFAALLFFTPLLCAVLASPPAEAEEYCVDRKKKEEKNSKKEKDENTAETTADGCPQIPPETKPPTCDRCEDACHLVDRLTEIAQQRRIYSDPELRAQVARYASDRPGHGEEEMECLFKEAMNEWLDNSFESSCPDGPSGKDLEVVTRAYCNMGRGECTMHCVAETEALFCGPIAASTVQHELHHQAACKAEESPYYSRHCLQEYGDPEKYGECRSGGRSKSECAQYKGHFDEKRDYECRLEVVNAFADEEVAGYDAGAGALRVALAELRSQPECEEKGMTTSNDLHLMQARRIGDQRLLDDALQLMLDPLFDTRRVMP